MATSGPITYFVMEDQFLSVAARHRRLPQTKVCGRDDGERMPLAAGPGVGLNRGGVEEVRRVRVLYDSAWCPLREAWVMKAAVIDSLERGPRFADFAEPVVTGGETLVEVTAAGLHPIVRMLASGEHYGSQGMLPMIPGIDGTGRAPDGTRVYFGGVRAPWGPMAQRAAAGLTLPLPDGLDEVTAAAIVNPGVGAWLALTRRAIRHPRHHRLPVGPAHRGGHRGHHPAWHGSYRPAGS